MSTKKSEDKKIFQEFYKSAPQLFNDIIRAQRSEGLAFRGVSRSIENKPKIQRVFDNKFKLTVDCSENEFQISAETKNLINERKKDYLQNSDKATDFDEFLDELESDLDFSDRT